MCKQCLLLEFKIKAYYRSLNLNIRTINYYIIPYYSKICFKRNANKITNFIINYDILPKCCKQNLIEYTNSSNFTNLRC